MRFSWNPSPLQSITVFVWTLPPSPMTSHCMVSATMCSPLRGLATALLFVQFWVNLIRLVILTFYGITETMPSVTLYVFINRLSITYRLHFCENIFPVPGSKIETIKHACIVINIRQNSIKSATNLSVCRLLDGPHGGK